ncbi:DUF1232 domain-containing protein [Irregularibacter muris]|uniref:DUF1232 domain-containing protein n=1 Tax=Irregularibacter muris TaxID=1796619 RepID=A0AAE3HE47_9FIRM|nr:DUF1232 domain-containing protein [Irregularibacter muris]MCR1897774.1 DUF1232 domain-containing protein [Irregularibacter muris]
MKPYKIKQLLKKIKSLYKYILDQEVPFYKKLAIIFGFVYLLFPFDIIPDPILGLGLVDDIAVLVFIFNAFQGELDRYEKKANLKNKEKDNIIEDIDYQVKDRDERGE